MVEITAGINVKITEAMYPMRGSMGTVIKVGTGALPYQVRGTRLGRKFEGWFSADEIKPMCPTCGEFTPDGTCPDCRTDDQITEQANAAATANPDAYDNRGGLTVAEYNALVCATCGGELVTAEQDQAMEGWCQKCQHWGISALEMERKREGLAFWDRFDSTPNAVPESFHPIAGGDFVSDDVADDLLRATEYGNISTIPGSVSRVPEKVATLFDGAIATDRYLREKWLGEFLIHLHANGYHVGEYVGGGIEPRVASELAPKALTETIADYLSRY